MAMQQKLTLHFLAYWILSTCVGAFLADVAIDSLNSLHTAPTQPTLSFVALIFATKHFVISTMQVLILRRYVPHATLWVWASTIAGACIGLFLSQISLAINVYWITFAMEGFVLGFAQFVVLRQWIQRPAWWVLVSTLSIPSATLVSTQLWWKKIMPSMQAVEPHILIWANRTWKSLWTGLIWGGLMSIMFFILFRYSPRRGP